MAASEAVDDVNWMERLQTHPKTGQIMSTIDNIWLILEHDPNLRNKFALNKFAGRGEVLGPLPWCADGSRRLWEDNDNQGLYWYLEKYYHIAANGKTDGALSLHSNSHAFNDVTDYLNGLSWDGVPRLDTIFIDYLGAEDEKAWNAGEVDVLLAHPASCGYGLNLQQGGHHIIWYGYPNWNLELYQQTNKRLHRQGQIYPVIAHHLVVEGGMDEEVVAALHSKGDTQEALMQALKARIGRARKE
jgi:hypothetical protein